MNMCDNGGSQVTSRTKGSISHETLGIYVCMLLRLQAAKSADTVKPERRIIRKMFVFVG